MYRHLLTILLLGSVLLQSLQPLVIVINYQYNKDLFEKTCINKNIPTLQCHGQCQMNKKLKEEQQRDAGSNLSKLSVDAFTPYILYISVPQPSVNCTKSAYPITESGMHPIEVGTYLLRPPIGC